MTGAWIIKLNSVPVPIHPEIKPCEQYPHGWPAQNEMELLDLYSEIPKVLHTMKTDDIMTVECLLEE